MRKLFIGACAVATLVASADYLWINTAANVATGLDAAELESIEMAEGNSAVKVVTKNLGELLFNRADVASITQGEQAEGIVVSFAAEGSSVINPYGFYGVEVEKTGDHVIIRNNREEPLELTVVGTTTAGGVKVYSETDVTITLAGASITSDNSSAINVQTPGIFILKLAEGTANTLADAKKYTTTPADEKESGCLYTTGTMNIEGAGSLSVTGIKKHAITADVAIEVLGGDITVPASASDAFHTEAFTISGGSIDTSSEGDAIDAGAGTIDVKGGSINFTLATPDTKGLKADDKITLKKGSVTFNVTGDQCKAIKAKKKITLDGATVSGTLSGNAVVVEGDPSYCTAIKTDKNFVMESGLLEITHTGIGGKGISCDDAIFNGGSANISVSGHGEAYTDIEGKTDTYSSTCISTDGNFTLAGANLTLTAAGNASKGVKCDTDVNITAGSLTGILSGNAVITEGDPSYCAGIKADGNITVDGGSININHTGMGGKGISADGNATFNGGDFTIVCSGNGAQYTNTAGQYDAYFSTCISIDGNVDVLAGTFDLQNKGTAGKCLKSDLDMVIGAEGTEGPVITAKTSGARIQVSGTSAPRIGAAYAPGGGWPGGGPGGGWDNGDYSNPKIIKADGNLTVKSGKLTLTGSTEGGEGLESKKTLTIDGGDIESVTYDDAINAANAIVINGGNLYCNSSNNDAIDSNGTLTINGGVTVAFGASNPECSFDCDNNRFAVTGGTFVGVAGSSSTPTTSACTQATVGYTTAVNTSTTFTMVDASDKPLFSFKSARTYSSALMIFSAPGMEKGSSVKIYSGGTVNGGETFNGLTTGAIFTPGTLLKTASLTSLYTTVR